MSRECFILRTEKVKLLVIYELIQELVELVCIVKWGSECGLGWDKMS